MILEGVPQAGWAEGLVYHLDFHVYLRAPGVSQSQLKMFQRSPLHYMHSKVAPSFPTPQQRLGTAIHDAVLIPEHFGEHYLCGVEGDRRYKVVKEAQAAQAEANPGKTILSPEDFDTCKAIAALLHSEEGGISGVFAGEPEVSAWWTDKDSTLFCKGRYDMLDVDKATILDLKTTQDASPAAFRRSVRHFGYDIQAAHYCLGAMALGVEVVSYKILAVEKTPPFAFNLYEVSPELLSLTAHRLRALKIELFECLNSGKWPGYYRGVAEELVPNSRYDSYEDTQGEGG